MCLSASRRAISEDGGVVAVEHAVEEGFGGAFVDVGLGDVVVEDAVEAEGLVFGAFAGGVKGAGEALDGVVFGGVEDSRYT